jgi:hypothetical protein
MMAAEDLRRFAQQKLRPLLESVLDTPAQLAELASRSYQHDNGFTKLVLVKAQSDRGALRAHIWPNALEDEGNVHNHCWDFTSVVLAGALRFEEFAPSANEGLTAEHFAYVPSSDFEYRLRSLGETRLSPTASGVRIAGEAYSLSGEILHRTWAGSAGTITLLSQGVHRRQFADVYVTRAEGVPTQSTNTSLQPGEARTHIQSILKSLQTAQL